MKIKSQIRSVQLVFAMLLLLIPAGLTGCGDEDTEFLKEDSVQEEQAEKSDPEDKRKNDPDEMPETVIPEKEEPDPEQEDSETAKKEDAASSRMIYVDVCGAVSSPGVYELPPDSRVFQAIEKAGGYLPEAAGNYLNRARPLSDGQQIYVPTQEEVDSQSIPAAEDGDSTVSGNTGESSGSSDPEGVSEADSRINLNTADVSQLTTLTGVGESKALAIIAYREENGPFTSVEDIMNVPGIKEGTYEKIKDKIAIE